MVETTAPPKDPRATLQDLTAQATAKYAVKDYNAAAELYAYATELQAGINGEMSSANADLLYAYGRCLYHVAVKKSDVLGLSKAPGEGLDGPKATSGSNEHKRKRVDEVEDHGKVVAEDVVTQIVTEKGASVNIKEENDETAKPYFQFTGDENFDDSDEDEDGDEAEGDDGDPDEDDFSTAYEVLDMARVLLQKRLEELEANSTGNGKDVEEPSDTRQLQERLADTYDLQAEISLEGEKFPTAVVDLRSALDLKKLLYPLESSLIAEGHFKLSLALEFSSVTQQKDENGEAKGEAAVDEAMREEAAHELEAAISSCELRIQMEEAKLSSEVDGGKGERKSSEAEIDDVKDMVKELSQRLQEIRQPPVSINDPRGTGTLDGSNPLAGILGSMLGESPAAQKARIEEASKGANDLTGLVKKKKSATEDAHDNSEPKVLQNNGKRKLDVGEEGEEAGVDKKAKLEGSKEG